MCCARMIVIVLLLVPTSAASDIKVPNDSRVPRRLLEELASLKAVEGAVVGDSGGPGDFHLLSEKIVKFSTSADFLAFIEDRRPIVRAMGLVCLTRTDFQTAKPVLAKRLREDVTFSCFPWGCVGQEMTEGELAWQLLHDPGFLQAEWEGPQLVPEMIETDLILLADDRCRNYFFELQPIVEKALSGDGLLKSAHDLRTRFAGVDAMALAKSIGRLDPSESTRRFLIEIAGDRSWSARARMAAVSGLARDTNEAAAKYLGENVEQLTRISPSLNMEWILSRQRERAALEAAGRVYLDLKKRPPNVDGADDYDMAVKEWMVRKKNAFIAAHVVDSPVGIDEMFSIFSYEYMEEPKIAAKVSQALIRATSRLREMAFCWDADSYLVASTVARSQGYLKCKDRISPKAWTEIKTNIAEAEKALRADCESAGAARP